MTKQKNKAFILGALAIAVLLFAGFAFQSSRQKADEAAKTPKVDQALLVRPHSFVAGVAEAPVTVVEFFDPECESCRVMHPIVEGLLREFHGKIKVVYRYLPLHANSTFAAAALEEARANGKFEQALTLFFDQQPCGVTTPLQNRSCFQST